MSAFFFPHLSTIGCQEFHLGEATDQSFSASFPHSPRGGMGGSAYTARPFSPAHPSAPRHALRTSEHLLNPRTLSGLAARVISTAAVERTLFHFIVRVPEAKRCLGWEDRSIPTIPIKSFQSSSSPSPSLNSWRDGRGRPHVRVPISPAHPSAPRRALYPSEGLPTPSISL